MDYRTYCNNCKDFTLFDTKMKCKVCGKKYTTVSLKNVDPKLINQQEERVKKAEYIKVNNVLCYVTTEDKNMIIEVEIPKPDPTRVKAYNQIKPYLELRRNDKCACGSELKYKNCCLMSVNQIRRKHGL